MPHPILNRRIIGGGTLQPYQVGGLVFWVSGSAITGLTDGTAVATWSDQSGAGRDATQATGGLQPLYKTNVLNGLAVVRFDGTDDRMTTASSGLTALPYTYFAVAINNSAADHTIIDGNGVGNRGTFVYNGGVAWLAYAAGSGVSSVAPSATAWHIHEVVFDLTNTLYAVDGVQFAPGTSAQTPGAYTLAANYTGAASFLPGDIAEIFIYRNGVDASTRRRLRVGLAQKYNLAVSG